MVTRKNIVTTGPQVPMVFLFIILLILVPYMALYGHIWPHKWPYTPQMTRWYLEKIAVVVKRMVAQVPTRYFSNGRAIW